MCSIVCRGVDILFLGRGYGREYFLGRSVDILYSILN